MWEPQTLATLWASTACYRDSFTYTWRLLTSGTIHGWLTSCWLLAWLNLRPWWWRQFFPPKCQWTSIPEYITLHAHQSEKLKSGTSVYIFSENTNNHVVGWGFPSSVHRINCPVSFPVPFYCIFTLLSVLAFRYYFSTRGRKFKTVMSLSREIRIRHMKNISYDIIEQDDLRYVSIIAVTNRVISYRVQVHIVVQSTARELHQSLGEEYVALNGPTLHARMLMHQSCRLRRLR
jgi:hypothetical protein